MCMDLSNSSVVGSTFRGVIFDLDGTLVSSLKDIAEAANHALQVVETIPPLPIEAYAMLAGDGNYTLMERALRAGDALGPSRRDVHEVIAAALAPTDNIPDRSRVERCVATKLAYERGPQGHQFCVPFDGISEMLLELEKLGVQMAVLSNKTEREVRHTVERLFGTGRFVHVAGATSGKPLKPDPVVALSIAENLMNLRPHEVTFIGDTSVDMKTAVSAGMYAVGVKWGFRSTEELVRHGARIIVSRPEEILSFFERSP